MQMLMSWYTSKQDVPNRDIIPYMGLIDVFYPKICVGCRQEGAYICLDCQKKLIKPEEICPACRTSSLGGWVHRRCSTRYGMDRLLVGLPYRGMVQDCLKKVKYKSAREIVDFLFQLCRFDLEGGVVTDVPMYRQKALERGFNQAELIARVLARHTGLPYIPLLARVVQTRPMYGLSTRERVDNVRDAFRFLGSDAGVVRGQRVILIDDIWTTGATLRECTQVLKRAGASEVWVVVLAR